jgi:hypothetical protein
MTWEEVRYSVAKALKALTVAFKLEREGTEGGFQAETRKPQQKWPREKGFMETNCIKLNKKFLPYQMRVSAVTKLIRQI